MRSMFELEEKEKVTKRALSCGEKKVIQAVQNCANELLEADISKRELARKMEALGKLTDELEEMLVEGVLEDEEGGPVWQIKTDVFHQLSFKTDPFEKGD